MKVKSIDSQYLSDGRMVVTKGVEYELMFSIKNDGQLYFVNDIGLTQYVSQSEATELFGVKSVDSIRSFDKIDVDSIVIISSCEDMLCNSHDRIIAVFKGFASVNDGKHDYFDAVILMYNNGVHLVTSVS